MKKWLKAVILTYLSLLFFGSFIAMGILWTGVFEDSLPFLAEIKIFLYYFFAGAIGGSLRHLYMFCSHYMEGELNDYRKWIMYIFYPIFATGTAIVAVTLIQSGLLLIEFTDYQETPYAPISIAFFVGFGFNRFVNLLNKVSKNMFQTSKKENNNIDDEGPGPSKNEFGIIGPMNTGPGNVEPINYGPGFTEEFINGPDNIGPVNSGPGSMDPVNSGPGENLPISEETGNIDPEPTNIGPEHIKSTRNGPESPSI